jgi:hypothetical protein
MRVLAFLAFVKESAGTQSSCEHSTLGTWGARLYKVTYQKSELTKKGLIGKPMLAQILENQAGPAAAARQHDRLKNSRLTECGDPSAHHHRPSCARSLNFQKIRISRVCQDVLAQEGLRSRRCDEQ